MEFLVIYLFVMLTQISDFLLSTAVFIWLMTGGVVMCTLIGCSMCMPASLRPAEYTFINHKKKWYFVLILAAIFFTVGKLLPSPKQAAVIFAGGMTYQVVTSDKAKELGGKLGAKVEQELTKLLSVDSAEVVEKAKGVL